MLNIATWTREYFVNPLSLNSPSLAQEMQLESHKEKAIHQSYAKKFSGPKVISDVLWSDESTFQLFLGKQTLSSLCQRKTGPFRLLSATGAKACHVMG